MQGGCGIGRGFQASGALVSVMPRLASVLVGFLAVVLLGAIGGGTEAMASKVRKVRYTLIARLDSTYDRKWSRAEVSPPYFGWESWHETTALAGRSARSFVITRSADGRSFRFSASMVGGLSHAGSGVQYDWGALAIDDTPDLNSCLTTQRRWSATGARLVGRVSMTTSRRGMLDAAFGYKLKNALSPIPILWTLDRVCQSGYTYKVRSDASPRTPFGWRVKSDQLRRRFGRAFTITSNNNDPNMDVGGRMKNRLVLRFVPAKQAKAEERRERQRWQVDVRGTDQWRWGVLTGLRAGVDVDWRHRTTLVIEDGAIVSATGKVSIERVRPYSEPPGVFEVTPTDKKTWPKYKLPSATKSKRSKRVTLMTYDNRKRSSSEYLLKYAIRLTGPQALDIIRQAGLPIPDVLYGRLAERVRLDGPVIDSVAPFVPDPPGLVFLLREGDPQRRGPQWDEKRAPCPKALSDQSCFLARGGQTVTVKKLR